MTKKRLPPGITQLPSGEYRAQVRVKGVESMSATRSTIKAANEWRIATLADIQAGRIGKFPNKTLAQVLDHYGEKVSSKKAGCRWELIRIEAYKRQFKALPGFGDVLTGMPFWQFDTPHFVAWRDLRLSQVSEGGVKRDVDLLRNVFRVARLEWKWTDKNPFEGAKLPRDNPARERRVPWTEVRRIVRQLGYVTGEVPSTKKQEIAYAFLLALRTALRTAELLRLTDDSVDIGTRVLKVRRKTHHLTRQIRKVPFTYAAARLFKPLLGWGGPLFTVSAATKDVLFREARDQLMIDDLHFHDSRAEALTRLSKKVDVLTLSKISDHMDLKMLSQRYYRETAEDIAKRL